MIFSRGGLITTTWVDWHWIASYPSREYILQQYDHPSKSVIPANGSWPVTLLLSPQSKKFTYRGAPTPFTTCRLGMVAIFRTEVSLAKSFERSTRIEPNPLQVETALNWGG